MNNQSLSLQLINAQQNQPQMLPSKTSSQLFAAKRNLREKSKTKTMPSSLKSSAPLNYDNGTAQWSGRYEWIKRGNLYIPDGAESDGSSWKELDDEAAQKERWAPEIELFFFLSRTLEKWRVDSPNENMRIMLARVILWLVRKGLDYFFFPFWKHFKKKNQSKGFTI